MTSQMPGAFLASRLFSRTSGDGGSHLCLGPWFGVVLFVLLCERVRRKMGAEESDLICAHINSPIGTYNLSPKGAGPGRVQEAVMVSELSELCSGVRRAQSTAR